MNKILFFYLLIIVPNSLSAANAAAAYYAKHYLHNCEQRVHKIMPLLGFAQSHNFPQDVCQNLQKDFIKRFEKKTARERSVLLTDIYLLAEHCLDNYFGTLLVEVPADFYSRLLHSVEYRPRSTAAEVKNQLSPSAEPI